MFQAISTVLSVFFALALFQTATLVIGGHIAKDMLGFFYQMFPEWWQRMLIVIIPLSGLGNIFAVYAFQNPVVAGVTFLIAGLWSPLIIAAIIDRASYGATEFLIVGLITALGIILGFKLA